MTRLLAGILEAPGATGTSAQWAALAGEGVHVSAAGPLGLATEGPLLTGPTLTVFDGVLDNARELSASLGLPSTDPETLIAHGYRRHGAGILERLDGDFSLLIWDREHERGLLARDAMGAGGLFLRTDGRRLWFASEIAHLLAILPSTPAPDRTSLAHWAGLSARPGPHTLYEGLERLEPGSVLTLTGEGAGESERYWQPRFREPTVRSAPAIAGELRGALQGAVQRRLPAQGRTGVLMSGGLDSASVAAIAARQDPQLLACSGVFPGHPQVDEAPLIATLRERLHVQGLTASVQAGGLLGSIVEHIGRWRCPPLGWSDFWTVPLLHAAARAGVTVTLGGDGGDELFGVRAYLLADELRALHPRLVLALSHRLPGSAALSPRARGQVIASLALGGALGRRTHTALHRARSRNESPWLTRSARLAMRRSEDPYRWRLLDGPRWWAEPAYALTQGIEQAGILEHQRTRAASAGLRARHPLLDRRLLELALSQSPQASFDPDLTRPLLREAMRGALPESVRMRPAKAWFDSLIAESILRDRAAIAHLLSAKDARTREYLAPGAAERALLTVQSAAGVPRFQAIHLLWRALGIECWLRAQEGGDALAAAVWASGARVEIETHPAPGDASGR